MSLPGEWTAFVIAVAAALLGAVIITLAVTIPIRLVARRAGWDKRSIGSFRRPFRALVLTSGLWIAVAGILAGVGRRRTAGARPSLRVAVIGSGGWLRSRHRQLPVRAHPGAASHRHRRQPGGAPHHDPGRDPAARGDGRDRGGHGRRHPAHLRRRAGVRVRACSPRPAWSASSPASPRSPRSPTSSPGLQLAFSDAIRVDDVVIADGEWGRIEEITLTYIVVRVWDDRRVILPSTYFTIDARSRTGRATAAS